LDTREKIVPAQAVRATGAVLLVVAYFDPLHAVEARRIHELSDDAGTVVVALDDPPDPLLSRRARAELAASLSVVDYVVMDSQAAVRALATARVYDLRAEHSQHRESLARHVQRRQQGG
jgi:hypothetical protein